MTKTVLVTGGAGFIGSHVAELALARGYKVIVFDNFSQGKPDWIPDGADCLAEDVTDLDAVRKAMQGVDGVFHLAAMSRVLPSINAGAESAIFSASQNIMGTLNVLTAAAEQERKPRVVYSASSTAYGNTLPPHREDAPVSPETPYAVSKYVGELYCQRFSAMYGVPTVCLRYFQVYGPRCPSTGAYAMVSSIFIEQAARGEPLTIHGDGEQRRDFVHVYDVAQANLKALERPELGAGEVINFGVGMSHSINELADLISSKQVHVEARKLDMKETRADVGKCWRLLEWVPTIGFVKGTIALKNGTGDFR
jgi:nucleoside-diphosphate-sugar epimerase